MIDITSTNVPYLSGCKTAGRNPRPFLTEWLGLWEPSSQDAGRILNPERDHWNSWDSWFSSHCTATRPPRNHIRVPAHFFSHHGQSCYPRWVTQAYNERRYLGPPQWLWSVSLLKLAMTRQDISQYFLVYDVTNFIDEVCRTVRPLTNECSLHSCSTLEAMKWFFLKLVGGYIILRVSWCNCLLYTLKVRMPLRPSRMLDTPMRRARSYPQWRLESSRRDLM